MTGKMINWYEKMPKSFLDTPNNPNFALHQLKIPFRMCVVAPSGILFLTLYIYLAKEKSAHFHQFIS